MDTHSGKMNGASEEGAHLRMRVPTECLNGNRLIFVLTMYIHMVIRWLFYTLLTWRGDGNWPKRYRQLFATILNTLIIKRSWSFQSPILICFRCGRFFQLNSMFLKSSFLVMIFLCYRLPSKRPLFLNETYCKINYRLLYVRSYTFIFRFSLSTNTSLGWRSIASSSS